MTQTVRTAVSHILALLLIYWRKWQSENITISYLLVFPPQRHLQKIFEYLCVCPYLYLCVCPYFSFLRITYSCSISGASQRCSHGQWGRRMYLYFKEDLHNMFIWETDLTISWPRIILHWKINCFFCGDDVSKLKQEMNEWLRQYLRYFCSLQILKKMHQNHNWLSRPQPNISRSFAMLAFSKIFIWNSIIFEKSWENLFDNLTLGESKRWLGMIWQMVVSGLWLKWLVKMSNVLNNHRSRHFFC